MSREFLRDAQSQKFKDRPSGDSALSHFSSGLGQIEDISDAVVRGNLDALDLSKLGLKSTSALLMRELLTVVNTQALEEPFSALRNVTDKIREGQLAIQRIKELATRLESLVEEIARFDPAALGDDLLEMSLDGIPGFTEDELIKMLGR